MRYVSFLCILVIIIGCESKINTGTRPLFGNVFLIDSIAGQNGLSDPFFIVLTKDSLFNAYSYWGYSFPYETELRINKSLEVLRPNGKWTIEPEGERFWLNMDTIRLMYSIAPGDYDSVYKHLRIIKTQESLLLGQWEIQKDKTEAGELLRCYFQERTLFSFEMTKNNRKIVKLINIGINGIDTCLLRNYRLNGSDIVLHDYDTFPPYKIIELNNEKLVIQRSGDRTSIYYLKKVH